jgi:ABC-2 type transport system ATP-binding protein
MDALVIKDLRKVYANGVEALKGIDLTVREGDFFALLGPNGAGKTTTIGIITSLIRKSGGSVRVFGHDLETARDTAKSCIGVVPQEINLNMFERNDLTLINRRGTTAFRRTSRANARRSTSKRCTCGKSASASRELCPAA